MVRRSAVLVSVLLLAAVPLVAQTEFGIFAVRPTSSTTHDPGGDIHFRDGNGYGVSLTRYWSNHLALEAAASQLHQPGTVDFGGQQVLDVGRLRMRPISLALQWHLFHGETVDPYVGAGAAYVFMQSLSSADLDNSGIGNVEVKNGFAPLANAGVNVGIGHSLALAFDFKYLRFRPDSGPADARVRLDLNPLIMAAGLRFRF